MEVDSLEEESFFQESLSEVEEEVSIKVVQMVSKDNFQIWDSGVKNR